MLAARICMSATVLHRHVFHTGKTVNFSLPQISKDHDGQALEQR